MIPVRNIYYMLSYAFQALQQGAYRRMSTEDFENVQDLLSEILILGMNSQIKRGIERGYVEHAEDIVGVRGRIDIAETLKGNTYTSNKLICEFDEYTTDTPMNRIVKATLRVLSFSDIPKHRKKEIRGILGYLTEVKEINLQDADWNFRYNRNNQTYRLLIGICELIYKGMLLNPEEGTAKLADFFDDQSMHRLYEKFILEYFKREHKELKVSASQIPWALDSDDANLLPIMQSDITLENDVSCFIIDAKYYSHTLTSPSPYSSQTIQSGNLYQIFSYVKNKAAGRRDLNVSGMLLYAKTDEGLFPDERYVMDGNDIYVRTLDLSLSFEEISSQLDAISELVSANPTKQYQSKGTSDKKVPTNSH